MTLIQLEYVVAVDTYKSFIAAAEKCFVTQPTLSMQIQKLETALGVKIFDRSRQPVELTEIGREIVEQARVIIMESKKVHEIIQSAKGEVVGDLKIGIIPTVAPYLLPSVITKFLNQYPKVQLQVWEYTTDQIIQELKKGTLDCGILSTPLKEANIIESPLYYESFVAYVSINSNLYKKKTLKGDDLSEEKLWLLNEGHCMREQVLNICRYKRNNGTDGAFEYNTGSVETLKRMVDINKGVTILPELSIREYNEDQMEHIRYFESPEPVREISVVTTQNFVKKQAVQTLKSVILDVVPERFKSRRKKDVMSFNI